MKERTGIEIVIEGGCYGGNQLVFVKRINPFDPKTAQELCEEQDGLTLASIINEEIRQRAVNLAEKKGIDIDFMVNIDVNANVDVGGTNRFFLANLDANLDFNFKKFIRNPFKFPWGKNQPDNKGKRENCCGLIKGLLFDLDCRTRLSAMCVRTCGGGEDNAPTTEISNFPATPEPTPFPTEEGETVAPTEETEEPQQPTFEGDTFPPTTVETLPPVVVAPTAPTEATFTLAPTGELTASPVIGGSVVPTIFDPAAAANSSFFSTGTGTLLLIAAVVSSVVALIVMAITSPRWLFKSSGNDGGVSTPPEELNMASVEGANPRHSSVTGSLSGNAAGASSGLMVSAIGSAPGSFVPDQSGEDALGSAAMGTIGASAVDEAGESAALGSAAVGSAAVGSAAVGSAAVGSGAVGSAAVGSGAVGSAALEEGGEEEFGEEGEEGEEGGEEGGEDEEAEGSVPAPATSGTIQEDDV